MKICHCALAGTDACKNCNNTTDYSEINAINKIKSPKDFDHEYYPQIVKLTDEEILSNGDYEMTFECPEWLVDLLKQKYGDDYEKKFNEDYIKFLTDLIACNENKG